MRSGQGAQEAGRGLLVHILEAAPVAAAVHGIQGLAAPALDPSRGRGSLRRESEEAHRIFFQQVEEGAPGGEARVPKPSRPDTESTDAAKVCTNVVENLRPDPVPGIGGSASRGRRLDPLAAAAGRTTVGGGAVVLKHRRGGAPAAAPGPGGSRAAKKVNGRSGSGVTPEHVIEAQEVRKPVSRGGPDRARGSPETAP